MGIRTFFAELTKIIVIATVVMTLMILVIAINSVLVPKYSIEKAQGITEKFIMTYTQYGSDLELIESDALQCENCFIFLHRFSSSSENKTSHTSSVVVQKNEVIQAIIDNTWDELSQKEIKDDGESKIAAYYCTDICPEKNVTVCGSDRKDHKSPCEACKQEDVRWYVMGECAKGSMSKAIDDIREGKISKESAAVIFLIAS
ncbi:hypothetical protein COV93_07085 [Candidatus Woesearchaeota archaeon CG11_big_fil_rev_8_21_14_0_20_43_8]|nr:MAG: hypothetical protein COV93_07085 [Candidatus Woesearchaeota archaeon CG11_big_fil_rev_8_21_14_0_20_43_8]PIO06993.1 MAG: hypothetical protein COT47_01990 [Candidatus Woesearchaeota archaeon CG08_land_8_20_14_0_20_43_7]